MSRHRAFGLGSWVHEPIEPTTVNTKGSALACVIPLLVQQRNPEKHFVTKPKCHKQETYHLPVPKRSGELIKSSGRELSRQGEGAQEQEDPHRPTLKPAGLRERAFSERISQASCGLAA